jgi:hypothetical protein
LLLIAFLFVSGCQYGKHKQTVTIAKLETELGVCRDANSANLKTIKELKDANALYASESAEQVEKAGKVQKDLKTAQKRADALEKALQKDKERAYKKNPAWSGTAVPDDVRRLFEQSSKD